MLKLDASARMKRRHLLVAGSKEDIESAILSYIGVLGFAQAAPLFQKHSTTHWIVSVERKQLTHVKAALALSNKNLNVLKVSGTLQGLGVSAKKHKP